MKSLYIKVLEKRRKDKSYKLTPFEDWYMYRLFHGKTYEETYQIFKVYKYLEHLRKKLPKRGWHLHPTILKPSESEFCSEMEARAHSSYREYCVHFKKRKFILEDFI